MVTIDGSTHIEQDAMEIDDGGEQATFEWKKGNAVVEPSPIDKNNTDWGKIHPSILAILDPTPYDIFTKVCKFKELLKLFVEESTRYMHQQGILFEITEQELEAF